MLLKNVKTAERSKNWEPVALWAPGSSPMPTTVAAAVTGSMATGGRRWKSGPGKKLETSGETLPVRVRLKK